MRSGERLVQMRGSFCWCQLPVRDLSLVCQTEAENVIDGVS